MGTSRCTRRQFLGAVGMGTLAAAASKAAGQTSSGRRKPNFVVIFTDDQGYADAGCYGAEGYDTPHLDRMAAEGVRFTDFYAAGCVCSPSRAGLMTGCYPARVGLPGVLSPRSDIGLNPDERTIAEVLKEAGYATACYGKWHLGHHRPFLPTHHGFDEYIGLPYSNDMWPRHPQNGWYPDLPLIEGDRIIQLDPDQTQLTTWYTERAVDFIERRREQPFFLYVPHSMVHVPLFVSDKFKGKSKQGLYGDTVMEIDWSVGQILAALKRCGLEEDTLVVFTSDNGPWLSYGNHAGSALPLREGKGTTFDGGQREIGLMRWPGTLPAGQVCREPCGAIDLLPTFAKLAGVEPPQDRVIDGKDIWPLMTGQPGAKSPHEALYFYRGNAVQAVRAGKWKLHLPHEYRSLEEGGRDGQPGVYGSERIELALFDLEADIGEQNNVAAAHPDIAAKLKHMAESFDEALKANSRPPGRIERPRA